MKRFLIEVAQRLYGFYAFVVFWVLILPMSLLVTAFPGVQRRRQVAKRCAQLIFLCLGIRVRVSGIDTLPDEPCVVAANHASYLDGILLTGALPARFSFVIKREITQVPIAHMLLRRIGSEFVERFDRHQGASDARRLLRQAANGQNLVFFPEGTFRREPGLQRFHSGAFAAAARAEMPVVPVAIRGSRHVLPEGSWLPRYHNIQVTIRPPVAPSGTGGEAVRNLKSATRASLLETLNEPDLGSRRPEAG